MSKKKKLMLHCCGCNERVRPRLTDGAEIYPHRTDLHSLPFWKCDACNNFVGCHHKTEKRTRPLGCIPTKEIRDARKHIHAILDPIWKSGKLPRGSVYEFIADKMDRKSYHTADIRSVDDARLVYRIVMDMRRQLEIE